MNESYYQDEPADATTHAATDMRSNYQTNSGPPVGRDGFANMNSYQGGSIYPPTNNTATANDMANRQGQSTGAEGNGPDFICKILDKLEKKFGGERFNNHDNDAKNLAMNQKLSARIKTIGPMVMRKLPQVLPMLLGKLT